MATIAAPQARWQRDRKFFTGVALAWVVVTFIGFAPSYYLGSWMGARPLGPLVHLHGIVFTTWILLYLTQNGLIALGRPDIHRRSGVATLIFALVVLAVGVAVAIESGRLGHGPPTRHQPSFLAYPLANMVMFAIFTLLGLLYRKRSEFHKRLMFLATLGLVITPLARISRMSGLPFDQPAIGGMILSDLFVAALVIFDRRSRGRIHPATLWAGGAYLASQPLRVAIGNSEPWQDFAITLIG